ncbi:hypothetical protein DFS33DRAFT_1297613 [Desarmillaria ectypa]|nr:hypothetical protein DFS33DRAFT_1297613 [Desarmillaria ectypa]
MAVVVKRHRTPQCPVNSSAKAPFSYVTSSPDTNICNVDKLTEGCRVADRSFVFLLLVLTMDSETSESSRQSTPSRSPTSDSDQPEVVVTEDTKQKFAREFRKRPNVHDLMQWKKYHNNMVCKNCLSHRQDCTPKENSAVCISCEEQRVGCSRAEQERMTRVRRLLDLSYLELEFLVDWYKKRRETKGSITRRPPITPSTRKTKFQDSLALSPEIQARTARAHRHEPEEEEHNASSSASQILSSSPVYEHDPMDYAIAANFQEIWNEYMNCNYRSASPQMPSMAGSDTLDFVTPEHTYTQAFGDLVMTDYEGLETSTERADVSLDEAEASTEVQDEEGASAVMPAGNQAALTYIELLLHKKQVEKITARVRSGDIAQRELVNALVAVSEGLLGMAMKYNAGSEPVGQASVVGSSEQ